MNAIFQFSKKCARPFYENSILYGLNGNLEKAAEASQTEGFLSKMWKGLSAGVVTITMAGVLRKIALPTIISLNENGILPDHFSRPDFVKVALGLNEICYEALESISEQFPCIIQIDPTIVRLITLVLSEEIVFRFVLQNSIYALQTAFKDEALENQWHEKKIVQAICSPRLRIILTTAMFALCHLDNPSRMITVASILLFPVEAILYETTGNFLVPIIAHLTNNFINEVASLYM